MGPEISFYEGSWESGGKNQELPGKDCARSNTGRTDCQWYFLRVSELSVGIAVRDSGRGNAG